MKKIFLIAFFIFVLLMPTYVLTSQATTGLPPIWNAGIIQGTHVNAGSSFSATYIIINPNSVNIQVGLGMTIQLNGGQLISDTSNDILVTLVPGLNSVSRPFHVPSNAPTGDYGVQMSVWSGMPNNSNGIPFLGPPTVTHIIIDPSAAAVAGAVSQAIGNLNPGGSGKVSIAGAATQAASSGSSQSSGVAIPPGALGGGTPVGIGGAIGGMPGKPVAPVINPGVTPAVPGGGGPAGGTAKSTVPPFGIKSDTTLPKFIPPACQGMTIATDKPSYQSGDTVTATMHPNVGTLVAVQVIAPDGKTTILSRTVTVGTGGDGSLQFKIGDTYLSGTYNIIATSTDGKTTDKCSAPFSVSGGSFTIISVTPTDQQGNPVTSFTKGQLGYVKVVVSSSSSVTALVSVNPFGPDLTSLGIGSVKSTVNGNAEMVISFFVPSGAQSGTANIYTDGLSDWPSQGGVPLTEEKQATVSIG